MVPEMEQVKYAISVDSDRPALRSSVGVVANRLDHAGLWRSSHAHSAGFSILATVSVHGGIDIDLGIGFILVDALTSRRVLVGFDRGATPLGRWV